MSIVLGIHFPLDVFLLCLHLVFSRLYEPYEGPDGAVLERGRLIGHGAKWKKAKTRTVPAIKVDHPKAREIGLALLEITNESCLARYMELQGDNDKAVLIENYREEFEDAEEEK